MPSGACVNWNVAVREDADDVIFLHQIVPGSADKSYGIHVARLAGLPPAVILRAEEVLRILEAGDQAAAITRLVDDLPLFSAAVRRPLALAAQPPAAPSAVETALAHLNPDELTPREALETLYRLRGMLKV